MTRKLLSFILSAALVMGSFMLVPAPAEAATVVLNPAIGVVGTTITVTGQAGGGYENTPGTAWFDSNDNSAIDTGEPTSTFTTSPTGTYSTTLPVPAVLASTTGYPVRVSIGSGPADTGFALFTVTMLSPTSGGPTRVVSLIGAGFAPNALGVIWFDSDSGNDFDVLTEPYAVVTTTSTGAIPAGTTLTIPNVATGTYYVLADIPYDGNPPFQATSAFIVLAPTLSPNVGSGIPGDTITVSGSNYFANTSHRVYWDSNNNSAWDTGEYFVDVTTSPTGTISTPFVIPPALAGVYQIRVGRVAPTYPSLWNFGFTISPNTIRISPATGVAGTTVIINVRGGGFTPGIPGTLWFNHPTGPSIPIASSSFGHFSAALVVTLPTTPGAYTVAVDMPHEAPPPTFEATATFNVTPTVPTLTLSPTSGGPGTIVTVNGSNFANIIGLVWFDTNNNGAYDAGEPSSIQTGPTFATNIAVPVDASPGTYNFRADLPLGGTVEASTPFTVLPRVFTLSATSGGPGSTINVSGSGFLANSAGLVWLDTTVNGEYDAGELVIAVSTSPVGAIAATPFTLPTTLVPGSYDICVDVPVGSPLEATAVFTVVARSLAVTPTVARPNTAITLTGAGYLASTAYRGYIDLNNNDALDATEAFVGFTTTATGAIPAATTLTLPQDLTPGSYFIKVDITPFTAPSLAIAVVTVPNPIITLNPTLGLPGTTVTVSAAGLGDTVNYNVYFDINNNSNLDLDEPSVVATTNTAGSFTTLLTIPNVASGTYCVRVDFNTTAPVNGSATFTVPAAPTITASVSPTSIVRGDTATLTWTTTNATTLTIFPGIGTAPLSGSFVVNPTVTTTYIFTATGPGGTATASVTLTVTTPPPPPPPPLPTITASVTPTSIVRGANATLTWSTTNATTVSIFPGIGAVPTAGSLVVSPTVTTRYTITATGPGGTVNFDVTLTVTDPPPPPPPPRVVELRIGSTFYKVDGVTMIMDAAPYIEFGRTFVPVRFVVTGLGGTVEWDGETRTVIIRFTKPVLHIRLVIGEPVAVVGTTIVPIDEDPSVVPVIKGGRTYVPLRFLVDRITGSSIEWVPPDVVIMRLPR